MTHGEIHRRFAAGEISALEAARLAMQTIEAEHERRLQRIKWAHRLMNVVLVIAALWVLYPWVPR